MIDRATPRSSRRIGLGLLVVAFAVALPACDRTSRRRPDVLLVTLDTTRADHLGCYGDADALTPRLDALAAGGVRFESAYTPVPLTLPAHTTILTGLAPPEHGLHVNGRERLAPTVPTLATLLRAAGYRTGGFVAAYVLAQRFGLDAGFEVYDDDLSAASPQTVPEKLSVHRPGNVVVDAALPWLASVVHDTAPFFLWVHLYDPHFPHHAHDALAGTRYASVASYDADVAFMDRQVGRLLDALDGAGVASDTLVIAVGDHGEGLGDHGDQEHGYLLNEETLHVPLLVRWPRGQRAGASVPALVGLADVAPTVLDVTGVATPPALHGRSLRAALDGASLPSRAQYAETDLPFWTFGWSPLRALTTPEWKYVDSTRPELYDRAADRAERHDLAAGRADVRGALAQQLTALQAAFAPAVAPQATVDADARAKLEALGYVTADGGGGRTPPPGAPLRDVKDMLATKQLGNEIVAGLATGRLDRTTAITMTRELVRQSPESAAFHFRLGTLLLQDGNPADAVAALRDAVRLRPEQAEAHVNLAQALTRIGQLEAALPEFRTAIGLAPDLPEASLGLGTGLAALGRLDEALPVLRDAVRLAPSSSDAQLNLGNLLLRRGDAAAAEAAYREALRLQPDSALAHHDLATLLARGDDVDDALTHAREAVRLAPNLATAHDLLGRLLVENGDVEAAIDQLQQATTLDPSAPEFFDDLGAAYAAAGRFPLAVTNARIAVRRAAALGRMRLAAEVRGRIAYYRQQGAAKRQKSSVPAPWGSPPA